MVCGQDALASSLMSAARTSSRKRSGAINPSGSADRNAREASVAWLGASAESAPDASRAFSSEVGTGSR